MAASAQRIQLFSDEVVSGLTLEELDLEVSECVVIKGERRQLYRLCPTKHDHTRSLTRLFELLGEGF